MISLRKIKKSDTKNILKWRNSSHIMNVFIDRNPLTKEIHYKWLDEKVKKGMSIQFIIIDDDDNKDIGSVYFRDIDKINNKAEIGIFIGEEEYKGKGRGGEAISKALDYVFTSTSINKVYARVLKYNKPSASMFIRLGFHKDGLLREDVIIDNMTIDVYIFSILKDEWINNGKKK